MGRGTGPPLAQGLGTQNSVGMKTGSDVRSEAEPRLHNTGCYFRTNNRFLFSPFPRRRTSLCGSDAMIHLRGHPLPLPTQAEGIGPLSIICQANKPRAPLSRGIASSAPIAAAFTHPPTEPQGGDLPNRAPWMQAVVRSTDPTPGTLSVPPALGCRHSPVHASHPRDSTLSSPAVTNLFHHKLSFAAFSPQNPPCSLKRAPAKQKTNYSAPRTRSSEELPAAEVT